MVRRQGESVIMITTKHKGRWIIALLVLTCVALIVYARSTRSNKNAYSLAGDLPRGALVYAQFENLPELIKQWEQSQLKERYFSSMKLSATTTPARGVEIDLALGRIQ
jgi:hypothetical protein